MRTKDHPDRAVPAGTTGWPLPAGEMLFAQLLVEKMIEWEPDSALNVNRQYVLDNWPHVRPVFQR